MSVYSSPDPAAAPSGPAAASWSRPTWSDPAGSRAAVVASVVLLHPSVARLDGGPFGTVASHLPGRRRVVGVRIGSGDEPVEIAVVVRLGQPLRQVADELAAAVRGVLGPVAVEVTFSDVVAGESGSS